MTQRSTSHALPTGRQLRRLLAIASIAALPSLAMPAHAEPATPRAREIFDRALQLMDKGRPAEACADFQRSLELERTVHALLQVGHCARRADRLLEARDLFREALNLAEKAQFDDAREAYRARAVQDLEELAPQIPTLIITSADATLEVRLLRMRGPAEVPSAADERTLLGFGEPLQLNPGPYRLESRAPDGRRASAELALRRGETLRIAAPLPPPRRSPRAAFDPGPSVGAEGMPPATTQSLLDQLSDTRYGSWPLIAGGAGVALLATGTVTGVLALNAKGDFERQCPSKQDCDPALRSLERDNASYALATDLLLGAGVTALATGATLYLLGNAERHRHSSEGRASELRGSCSTNGCGLWIEGFF